MASIIIYLFLFLLNLNYFCFASINLNDAVFVPMKNEDLSDEFQQKFMFEKNGEKIITSSGEFTVRYPAYENVFFFRLQTNLTSAGSVTFCFSTTESLKSQHYECKIGQCGMKFYFSNHAIHLNHDQYSLPFYPDETIIFGYSNQRNLKLRIGTKGYKEFLARCSIPIEFITVTNENQINFDVHYHLSNVKLELATSYLVIKGEAPTTKKPASEKDEDESAASASVTLGIICAFLIPVLFVIGLGEGYVLWTKRENFKRACSKKSKTAAATKTKTKKQPPPPPPPPPANVETVAAAATKA